MSGNGAKEEEEKAEEILSEKNGADEAMASNLLAEENGAEEQAEEIQTVKSRADEAMVGNLATEKTAAEKMHENGAEEDRMPSTRRRSSKLSASLYGPECSSRQGRPSRLASLVQKRSKASSIDTQALGSVLEEYASSEVFADTDTDEDLGVEDSGPMPLMVDPHKVGPTDESLHMLSPQDQRRLRRRLTMAPRHRSKMVQVNVENLSYHVPVQLDAHGKETVLNQSLLYLAYEFFLRFRNWVAPPENSQDTSYRVKSFSDLFVPYEKKTVLHDISLVFQPGKAYLVLGPPNSGRTTLLRAISGRLPHLLNATDGKPLKKHAHITGTVAYNGVTKEESGLYVSSIVSFVDQLDVHAPYLTVNETFAFARACRGQNSHEGNKNQQTAEPKENLTIEGLGLSQAQDTFVGNANVRGVSGGQRRRVTLGEMMQGDPSPPVACGDEISTGLDAAVTFDICQSIVNYSKLVGATRIVSLLQPGPETFTLFDEIVLLSEGFLVYAGPVEDVVDYFEALGYSLPATTDVADFMQSVTTVDGALLFNPEASEYNSHLTPQEFAEAFRKSKHARHIEELLQQGYKWKSDNGNITVPDDFKTEFRHSWLDSFTLNFKRHILMWWRDKGFIYGKMFENVGMAAATGGILFGRARIPGELEDFDPIAGDPWTPELAEDLQTLQEGVFSAIFMTCLHILLGTTTSTPDDIDERPIHYKQADAAFYHTTAFAFARLLSTLPQRAIEIVAFGIPVYFMVGLDASVRSFFLFLLILLTYTFSLKILYGIIAQILPNKQNVLGFGTFLVLLFGLFSGFIVYPDVIPTYYKWFYWMNPMAWAFQAMLITEFTSSKYTEYKDVGAYDATLESRGFNTGTEWIGYTFLFFIPYALAWACVLAYVLKKVRLEPKRAGSGSEVLVDDGSSPDFNLPFTPVDLTFEDLVYEVKSSTGDDMLKLLNGVSGVLRPGRMCALMGSSGAGKTTLMDVVSLRKESGTITGEVRMNGFLQERVSFLRSSGYVEQFDVQQPELTVRETVVFSARLRLSRDDPVVSTDEGRWKFVDYVLEMMELTIIQDVQVGSYEEGGLSFEQRKRLAIAVELAASPSIIFLDEPTSGLDSRGALVIMRALKRIADTGRTVCATIHQPSAAVFEMFDDLLLLKRGGEVVFFGELGEESCNLVEYFEERGAEPIQHGENPAAWMLRAYTGPDDDTDWKAMFDQSEQFQVLKQQLADIKESPDEAKEIKYDNIFAASSHTRMTLMIRRIFRIMLRAPAYNLTRISIAVVYAVIIGTVFLRTKNKDRVFYANDVDGILSSIFIALIIIGVVSVSMAVPVMKQIRDVFYKHRASGMLGHNSVTVAVSVGELPYMVAMSLIFSVVYYSLVGLFNAVNQWLWFFLFFGLNIATYTYFGQAFMCMVRDTNTAGALVGALIGFNVFFSGLVVRPQYFVGPFLVGFWTSPGRFAYEAIIITQFRGLEYKVIAEPFSPYFFNLGCNVTDLEDPDVPYECSGTMEDYVEFFFGGKFEEGHLFICLGVLLFCLCLARLLLWLSLWKFNYVNT